MDVKLRWHLERKTYKFEGTINTWNSYAGEVRGYEGKFIASRTYSTDVTKTHDTLEAAQEYLEEKYQEFLKGELAKFGTHVHDVQLFRSRQEINDMIEILCGDTVAQPVGKHLANVLCWPLDICSIAPYLTASDIMKYIQNKTNESPVINSDCHPLKVDTFVTKTELDEVLKKVYANMIKICGGDRNATIEKKD